MPQTLVPLLIALFYCLFIPAFSQPLSLKDSVDYWDKQGDFHKALSVSQRWKMQAEKQTGKESEAYAQACYQEALFFYELGDQKGALEALDKTYALQQKLYKTPNLEIARNQNLHGIVAKQLGDIKKALFWYEEAQKSILAGNLENDPYYGTVLNNLGTISFELSQFEKAAAFYNQAIVAYQKSTDERDLRFLVPKMNLASILEQSGNIEQSAAILQEIKEVRVQKGLSTHPDQAFVLERLGGVELLLGRYARAEQSLLSALAIRKTAQGENTIYYAKALNSLSDYYYELGNFAKAEKYTTQAQGILENQGLTLTLEYYVSLINLGRLMTSRKNYVEGLRFYRQASEMYKNGAEGQNQNYLVAMNNMALIYQEAGNFSLAAASYQIALKGLIDLKIVNGAKAMYLMNMGIVNRKMKQFAEAYRNISESIVLYEKLGQKQKFEYVTALNGMALLLLDRGNGAGAETYLLKGNQQLLKQFQTNFLSFSELEKEQFYTKVKDDLEVFNSFCQIRAASNPSITGSFYNHQLATKALLLNSSAKWKQRIKSSHDRKLLLKFTLWEEYRNRLNRIYQSGDSTERQGIDSLEERSASLEKELAQRSEHFAELADKKVVTWKDVQAKLKPGEAAIEMVRFRKYGVYRTLVDTSNPAKPTYNETGLTDTVFYAALVVKPGMLQPELVLLSNGNDLENKYLHYYQNHIRTRSIDEKSYSHFWKKIGDRLKDSHRIFLSPDGVYHKINLSTLLNPITKKYLLEEKDIRLVTVTKDLLDNRKEESENKLAYLYGHPSYYSSINDHALAMNVARKGPSLEYRLELDSLQTLADLPATKAEVNRIADLLYGEGWEVQNYLENRALEETIKEMYKPRVLHIATHGYFQTDTLKNPLLRSGVMLAGAGKTLKGLKLESGEDGILTAYEAMNLNLDNTDLVVLSACETGLGEVKNGEGVYGLQRAFKVAGAKSIIMSLWKVDDEATQELMVSFYKHWLGDDVRPSFAKPTQVARQPFDKLRVTNSKRSAFLAAQKELKAKYPNPYYWGAFVMVGE